ncbi:MAG: hypothetical protein JRC90_10160 [Deltaproteobacteria bacterium]|nr:hypothetical protein [Deltaproteobacteria bacterium]
MSTTAYLWLLVIMGFFMGMLPFVYFIFREPTLKTLFVNSLPIVGGKSIGIVADESGCLRLIRGKIENGIFQAKKHAFNVIPDHIYRFMGEPTIIGYTGFGGAINLVMPKAAENIKVKDNPGELVSEEITIPSTATVGLHHIRKIMEQNLPSSTLKEVELMTKAKAKAGMENYGKWIMYIVTLLITGAIAVYILSLAAAQGGGVSMPSLPHPGGIIP